MANQLPDDLELVNWDYGARPGKLAAMLDRHRELFGAVPTFAGGLLTWSGHGTHVRRSLKATDRALQVCKDKGVRQVYATMWGDQGAENNYFTGMLGMQLFAEHMYADRVDPDVVEHRIVDCVGIGREAFENLSYLNETPGWDPESPAARNPSKYLLWQDVLIGLFDKNVEDLDLTKHYAHWRDVYARQRRLGPDGDLLFEVPEKLAAALALKAGLGARAKQAYDSDDRRALRDVADHQIPAACQLIAELREAHRRQWMLINKPFGWEVLDLRYSGQLGRLESARGRLTEYLDGRIEVVDELAEDRLYFRGSQTKRDDPLPAYTRYADMVSAGDMGVYPSVF